MDLSAVLEAIQLNNLDLRPAGFFNVEGGDAALGSEYFTWCDSCLDQLGPITASCDECGRRPDNFLRVPAGDGDGVYVVFELFDSAAPRYAVGALVIFDNNYEIANAVRDSIMEERVPSAPFALIKKRGNTNVIDLGVMPPTTRVLFSDGMAGVDSKFAMVDVDFGSEQKLNVYGMIEQVSSNIRDEVNRLGRDAGMDRETVLTMLQSLVETSQAVRDMPKGYGTLPEVLFRGLLITQEVLAQKLELRTEKVALDWEELTGQYLGKICTSHQQTMEAAAVWFNVLLHREFDRAAGDVPSEEGKRLLFNMWTWVYQGLHNFDDDCRQLVNNAYLPAKGEVLELLGRRGLAQAAQDFLSSGKIGDFAIPVASESHSLPADRKASSEILNASSGTSLAKFCGGCGTKFERESDKYCSECGESR